MVMLLNSRGFLKKILDLTSTGKTQCTAKRTFFLAATEEGHHEIVKILLTQPLVNVNVMYSFGLTALGLACEAGNLEVIRLLCEDPRVDVNLTTNRFGSFPLFKVACRNNLEGVKLLIALRGEDLQLERMASYDGNKWTTSLEIATELGFTEITSLLEKFTANPQQNQGELRVELGFPGSLASRVFALVVFLCEDLLKIKETEPKTAASKFFTIATSLPMELQMVLCHRVVGSKKQNILSRDSEFSFRQLAALNIPTAPGMPAPSPLGWMARVLNIFWKA